MISKCLARRTVCLVTCAPVVLLLVFAGCASVHGPSKSELAAANFGAQISQSRGESIAREFLAGQADLSRATLSYDPVERGFAKDDWAKGGFEFGHRLYATLNEKDAAGYFKGPVNYIFIFRDEVLVAAYRVIGVKADLWDMSPRLMRLR